jgi:small subunit ribosomal protein S1
MSWTKKNVHPGKIVSTSQEIEIKVLDVDEQKRRISLGLKQCRGNPWEDFQEQYPAGGEIEGEIKNITEFGLFVGLPGDIDGMAHLSDLDWSRPGDEAIKDYNKGDVIKVKILDVDIDKERISLGVKQLTADPFGAAIETLKKGSIVTCTVHQIVGNGIEVELGGGMIGFIRKAELSRDRSEQRPDRFAVGEKVDAKITTIDKKSRKLTLSIKQREIEEEKQAMASYGSSDSGASLGEILGAAISKAAKDKEDKDPDQPAEEEAAEAEPAADEAAEAEPAADEAAEAEPAEDSEAAAEATEEAEAAEEGSDSDAGAAEAAPAADKTGKAADKPAKKKKTKKSKKEA